MSLKYAAQRIDSNHYVLPKVGGMRVEAHAYLSDDLYAASDEGLWQQVANGASYEGVIGAYLMPDTHLGFGVPVGSVIVTEDTIIQAGSGYDISCGVLSMKVPGLTAEGIRSPEKRRLWIDEVEKRIATGVVASQVSQAPKLYRY
jgi:tRNA-splicing ligase RtcB